MSRTWRAECIVDAGVHEVWAVLVDFDGYPRWNPFTREVRTTLAVGETVRMRVDLGPFGILGQRERVCAVEPGRRLAWTLDHWPRWLLHARRDQTLAALPDGRTRYVTEDVLSGALVPLVGLLFGRAMTRGFEALARELVREVARRRP